MPDHDSSLPARGIKMGMVISFPTSQRQSVRMESIEPREPGQVVILPVIRVERVGEQPADTLDGARRASGRKRRRRVSRS
jgi:hypothetical protein